MILTQVNLFLEGEMRLREVRYDWKGVEGGFEHMII